MSHHFITAFVAVLADLSISGCTARHGFERIPSSESSGVDLGDSDSASGDSAGSGDSLALGDALSSGDTCLPTSEIDACLGLNATCGITLYNDPCDGPRQIDCGLCTRGERCGLLENFGSCDSQTWYPLGNSDPSAYSIRSERVAIFPEGRLMRGAAASFNRQPLVTWQVLRLPSDVRVRRHNGSQWAELVLGDSDTAGISGGLELSRECCTVAFNSSGNPYVVWRSGFPSNVYLKFYNGTAWTEVGTGSSSGNGVTQTATNSSRDIFVLDADDNPVLAWWEVGQGIYVKQFISGGWIEMGTGSANGTGIATEEPTNAGLAMNVDTDGRMAVAWVGDNNTETALRLLKFNGTSWLALDGSDQAGGLISTPGTIFEPVLLGTSEGLLAAWTGQAEGPDTNTIIYLLRYFGGSWQDMGLNSSSGDGLSAAGVSARNPLLLQLPDGTLLSLWSECDVGADPRCRLMARQWMGGQWQDWGWANGEGPTDLWGHSKGAIEVTLDGSDIFASWKNRGGELALARYTDGQWLPYGDVSKNSVAIGIPDAENINAYTYAIRHVGAEVLLAWASGQWMVNTIHMARFSQGRWSAVSGVDQGFGAEPKLVFDLDILANGDLLAVGIFKDDVLLKKQVVAGRFSGSTWLDYGVVNEGITSTFNSADSPTIAVGPNDKPVVAWEDRDVFARGWDGVTWVDLGDNTPPELVEKAAWISVLPDVAVDTLNRPVVSYITSESTAGLKVHLRRLESGSWVGIAGSGTGAGLSTTANQGTYAGAHAPRMLLRSDDTPVVTWVDFDTAAGVPIFVTAYNGTSWDDLASGINALSGITGVAGIGGAPTVDSTDRIYLGWGSMNISPAEVYLSYFDGASWQEPVAGSASGLGISNSAAATAQPEISITDTEICVAWVQSGSLESELIVRCSAR